MPEVQPIHSTRPKHLRPGSSVVLNLHNRWGTPAIVQKVNTRKCTVTVSIAAPERTVDVGAGPQTIPMGFTTVSDVAWAMALEDTPRNRQVCKDTQAEYEDKARRRMEQKFKEWVSEFLGERKELAPLLAVTTDGDPLVKCQTSSSVDTAEWERTREFTHDPDRWSVITYREENGTYHAAPNTTKKFTVNWSTFGPVSPEEALAFATVLKRVAEMAVEEQAAFTSGLTIVR